MTKKPAKTTAIEQLLRSRVLDIRGAATKNEQLTLNEYFNKIEWFLQNAPLSIIDITSVSSTAEDNSFLDKLEEMKNTLSDIGYYKSEEVICGFVKAFNDESETLMKILSKVLADDMNSLHDKINDIFKTAGVYKVKAANDEPEESKEEITLSAALENIDFEDANRKLRVLAIDDVSIILHMITSVLSDEFEVFGLTKAVQLERFLQNNTPELFLLDIEMPDINGYDLIPVIRKFEEHKDTPILMLTGNATMDNLKTAVSLGVTDFIAKPVNRDILLEKVRQHIVRKDLL